MRTEPRDLDRRALADLLGRHWGIDASSLEHAPLGFGSHHWIAVDSGATRWFVTADDLTARFQHGPDAASAYAALEHAFGTAATLRDDAGLEFVVAPLRDREGAVLRRLDSRYAVNVSRFVEGASSATGRYESPDDRRRIGDLVGRLHAATAAVPAGLPRREDFSVPARDALAEALADVARPWTGGPFSEPARALLRAGGDAIERLFGEYDELASELRATAASWVVTHGEPHSANVIRGADGRLCLVDWDTTLVAPRERDLSHFLDADLTGWAEYREAAGAPDSPDRRALRLYALWWELANTALFTDLFRRPHEETEDTSIAWTALARHLAG